MWETLPNSADWGLFQDSVSAGDLERLAAQKQETTEKAELNNARKIERKLLRPSG